MHVDELLLRHFSDLDADYVIVDNVEGGYLVTSHLLEMGHRRIGHLAGPAQTSTSQRRLAGYRRAPAERSVPFDDIELAELLEVPLTTFRQPAREIGRLGAEILMARLRVGTQALQQLVLKPKLIVRRSSGCSRSHS